MVLGRGTLLRTTAWVGLVATVAWYPVSVALAGNLVLVFRDDRGRIWLWLTTVVTLFLLASLV